LKKIPNRQNTILVEIDKTKPPKRRLDNEKSSSFQKTSLFLKIIQENIFEEAIDEDFT